MKTLPWNVGAVGPEQCVGNDILFNSPGGVVSVAELPAGCLITKVVAVVETAFNAATTNTITVGDNEAPDNYASTGITAGTAGGYTVEVAKLIHAKGAVKAKFTSTGDPATAGRVKILVFFTRVCEA